jgi:uncharacterized membrane protein YdjX (TVP38/TMEM64 family)
MDASQGAGRAPTTGRAGAVATEAEEQPERPRPRPRPSQPRRRRLVTLLIVAVVATAVVVAFTTGFVDRMTDQAELERAVDDAGALGPVVFLALMIALVPLNVPGVIFVIPSTTLFGTVGGVTLSLVGGFVASAIGMVAARRLGRPYLESRLPPRVQRWEERLCRHGFWGVAGARTFTYLLQPVDWLCGLSSLPMRTALAGTFVGLIPPTVAISLSGGALLDGVL